MCALALAIGDFKVADHALKKLRQIESALHSAQLYLLSFHFYVLQGKKTLFFFPFLIIFLKTIIHKLEMHYLKEFINFQPIFLFGTNFQHFYSNVKTVLLYYPTWPET